MPSALKHPLAIAGVLVVLLYAVAGFASSSDEWTDAQRWLFSAFLFGYPFVVLGMAFVLVTKHSDKLGGPKK